MENQKMWVITDPYDHEPVPYTFEWKASETRGRIMGAEDALWPDLYKRGYRCERITVSKGWK